MFKVDVILGDMNCVEGDEDRFYPLAASHAQLDWDYDEASSLRDDTLRQVKHACKGGHDGLLFDTPVARVGQAWISAAGAPAGRARAGWRSRRQGGSGERTRKNTTPAYWCPTGSPQGVGGAADLGQVR